MNGIADLITHTDSRDGDPGKTIIRPNVTGMVNGRSASGGKTKNCGDFVARNLDGIPLDGVLAIAKELGWDETKYSHLNPGHQRMLWGAKLRKAQADLDAAFEQGKVPMNGEGMLGDMFQQILTPFIEQRNAAKAQAEKERAEREAEREANKKARQEAKAKAEANKKARQEAKAGKQDASTPANPEEAAANAASLDEAIAKAKDREAKANEEG